MALTYDGIAGRTRLYANGVLEQEWGGTFGSLGDHHPAEDVVWIGSRQRGGQPFHGLINEVRLWDVERTDSEIANHYDAYVPPNTPGLVASWSFDEEETGVAFDAVAAHHATLGRTNALDRPARVLARSFPGYAALPEPSSRCALFALVCGLVAPRKRRARAAGKGPLYRWSTTEYRDAMNTTTAEISDGIFRFSTCVPGVTPDGFTFNQFLIRADEPLLFHTGPRALFGLVSDAVSKVVPIASIRWIAFGHVEADECGSMNQWLAAAPAAEVAHGQTGVMVSLTDLADRPPRALDDGEVIDLGGKRVRHLDTPHVPHGWEARVLFEEVTGTLLCGDLFTHSGDGPALVSSDIVGPARRAEEVFRATCLTPSTGATIRKLAALSPKTLALMHGSSFNGDSVQALNDLADVYDEALQRAQDGR